MRFVPQHFIDLYRKSGIQEVESIFVANLAKQSGKIPLELAQTIQIGQQGFMHTEIYSYEQKSLKYV